MDFRHITPCGECCEGCKKKADGQCRGCRETDGHCEEWAGSGVCPAYACCKEHGALFCGVCPEFPCDHLPMLKWRPDCVGELRELAETYRSLPNRTCLYWLTLVNTASKRREFFDIGLFASRKEAEAVSHRYRQELPGFTRPEITAVITTVPVLDADTIPDCVYRWQGWDVDDELNEHNIITSDCFANESAAQFSLSRAQQLTPRHAWCLNRYVIGQCDWHEGFDTYTD